MQSAPSPPGPTGHGGRRHSCCACVTRGSASPRSLRHRWPHRDQACPTLASARLRGADQPAGGVSVGAPVSHLAGKAEKGAVTSALPHVEATVWPPCLCRPVPGREPPGQGARPVLRPVSPVRTVLRRAGTKGPDLGPQPPPLPRALSFRFSPWKQNGEARSRVWGGDFVRRFCRKKKSKLRPSRLAL